jgi:glycosyltransferase involved in cell wall biosynthesis
MISVVIPTYRKPALLRRTLEALLPQTAALAGGCELVVVDDGSADETAAVLEALQSRLPLCVQRPPRNEGRAKARNRGWRAARGETVLFLDDDILLEPGALAAHVRAQAQLPAAYLGLVVTAPEVVDSPLFGYLDTRGIAKRPAGGPVPARYFLTQNASVPRAALERVGGFDEAFGAYGFEDMELAFRLEERVGLRFFSVDGARGEHIHHHTLAQYLEKKRSCGRVTLALLRERHPARMCEMQLDLLPGMGGGGGPQRALLRALLRASFAAGAPRPVRAWLYGGGVRLPRRVRHRLYDYLVLAAYADGIRERDMPS